LHERPGALDPHVVSEIAKLGEVVMLARIEHNSNDGGSPLGRVQGVENGAVREHVGSEGDRSFRAADKRRVDGVKAMRSEPLALARPKRHEPPPGR
jgi:hypothetical protein